MQGWFGAHRRTRLAFVPLLIAVTIGLAACLPPPPPPPPTTSTSTTVAPAVSSFSASRTPASPADYELAFDGLRRAGAEWAAADGSIPLALPDGRLLWLFGDTIVGRVQADGSIADGWKMVRNTFVVQDGACFTPMMGGTRGSRTEILPNPASNEWFWPTAGVVETQNGRQVLRVFMLRLRFSDDPEPFNFAVIGVDVATYALPGLTRLSLTSLPLATPPDAPPYGQTVLVGSDGYLYLYGSQAVSCGCMFFDPREHRVARVPLGSETTPAAWEFASVAPDSSVTWSDDPSAATPMFFAPPGPDPGTATIDDGPRAPLEVVPYANGYLATAKTIDAFSDDVSTWFAPTPTGPWSYVGEAATGLPGDPTDTFSYGGRIVTDLPGSPVLIWSQNHLPLSDVIADNELYEARFASPAPAVLP